jgi:hypothetical protein
MAVAVPPRAWLVHRRERRGADYWIGHGLESRYPWRVAELTSERERRLCARSLHGVIDEVLGRKLPGAAPIRSAQLRPHLAVLEEIEERLRDGEPVAAVGMLAVNELLTSPASCLLTDAESVESLLRAVLVKLKVA